MKYLSNTILAGTVLIFGCVAYAAEQSSTFTVENFTCPSCAYMLKKTLIDIDGVKDVQVSLADQQVVVIYDDEKTGVAAFTEAAAALGFPVRQMQ